jgi:hypothetical protein
MFFLFLRVKTRKNLPLNDDAEGSSRPILSNEILTGNNAAIISISR